MLPDRVSNPGPPMTYKSGALPIALRGPAQFQRDKPDELIVEVTGYTFWEKITQNLDTEKLLKARFFISSLRVVPL